MKPKDTKAIMKQKPAKLAKLLDPSKVIGKPIKKTLPKQQRVGGKVITK